MSSELFQELTRTTNSPNDSSNVLICVKSTALQPLWLVVLGMIIQTMISQILIAFTRNEPVDDEFDEIKTLYVEKLSLDLKLKRSHHQHDNQGSQPSIFSSSQPSTDKSLASANDYKRLSLTEEEMKLPVQSSVKKSSKNRAFAFLGPASVLSSHVFDNSSEIFLNFKRN